MADNFIEEFTPGQRPDFADATLTRTYYDGSAPVRLTGERAVANANTHEGDFWRATHDFNTIDKMLYRHGSGREGMAYRIGQYVQGLSDRGPSTSSLGKALDGGAVAGGATMAGIGALSGLLAGWLKKKIFGDDTNPLKWALVASLLGGIGGAALGNARKRSIEMSPILEASAAEENRRHTDWLYDTGRKTDNLGYPPRMDKSAAMYNDPRNVILEKLMAATDIGYAAKAKLAAAVRKLNTYDAQRLADMVRATLGFGVGALIAKFLFGAGGTGMLFGGLAGVLGANVLKSISAQNSRTPFAINKPTTYADLLR